MLAKRAQSKGRLWVIIGRSKGGRITSGFGSKADVGFVWRLFPRRLDQQQPPTRLLSGSFKWPFAEPPGA